ncbi:nitrous oxide reductase accessory protein NosL [Undibacterium luofuense]|uniref:Nitrous oxide reductase accessory protein NosL n=1 Tax=Undibacterium luofuense TaxID=2828733 RepID=A0A941DPF0_9BURK|nr:nitrous oxide reductase accessory protein NosL [Undibacterium luofuense]MBR7781681.1 nitrous oxide reductase accessory protein NosL [Undibacterium luofuense]
MKFKKKEVFGSYILAAFALTGVLSLSACDEDKAARQAAAKEITEKEICSLDGMTLADYPGPKAQIKYEGEKEVSFFCDTIEFFHAVLAPEQVRKIESMYVQDMGKANWDNPREYWMDPSNGYYVVDSKRQGSMGPTIASFSQEADAKKYMSEWGGKLLRFKEINKGMVDLSGGALHDEKM